MNLIVACDRNWAIGNKGQMLVTIPEDQKLFRQETLGKVVVMGRKTLESLPGGQPLYGRTNLILTRQKDYRVKDGMVCHNIKEVLEKISGYHTDDIYIIGGQKVYEQFLPYCNTAHVTFIDYEYDADTYFPSLEKDPAWSFTEESDEHTYFDLCYTFRMYKKNMQNDR